jgi:hypothetical protein
MESKGEKEVEEEEERMQSEKKNQQCKYPTLETDRIFISLDMPKGSKIHILSLRLLSLRSHLSCCWDTIATDARPIFSTQIYTIKHMLVEDLQLDLRFIFLSRA